MPGKHKPETTISPDRLRIIAEAINPHASDNWLRGFEIAVSIRPRASEADILAVAANINAEAASYELGVAAGFATAQEALERRASEFHANLNAKLANFEANVTGEPEPAADQPTLN
ncbi:hypothetical protein [Brucella grignonensis]|uniref:Uncharacterized protein n=1 Tax=Brucella grignonensis TaxID=94627 RepID=A0A256FET0_9HYPH|nr:hypothetical protein [Brucella grignonensis]NKB83337.1 hypothetical protein [Brucella grignonensis]NKB84404.1 hypothetical protein [Brucella grignonensis]OYR13313.1 hypothetical protein CEV33_1038 [Brucella grignonensis]